MDNDAALVAFVGPAGVGKTYHLVAEVERISTARDWHPWESVLGLSFMHGARRRLASKLRPLLSSVPAVRCETIDSFTLAVVRRFARHAGLHSAPIAVEPDADGDWVEEDGAWRASFAAIRATCLALLENPAALKSLSAAYPIVVVDEFQDCDQQMVDIVAKLAPAVRLLVAADEFQDLRAAGNGCPPVAWLHEHADVRELRKVRVSSTFGG